MKRLVLSVALLASLALATPTDALAGPEPECLDTCDVDFPGGDYVTIAARGWCYLIRCLIL